MRAHIYTRVSGNKQKETRLGLETQIATCKKYCDEREILDVKVYEDGAVSGKKHPSRRPAFAEMLDSLESGDIVLVAKMCRFSRDLRDALNIEKMIMKRGCFLVEASSVGLNNNTPEARLMRSLAMCLAAYESEKASERMRAYKKNRRSNGKVDGCLPYGYTSDGENIVIDKMETYILEKALEMESKGITHRKIANELDSEGHKTRTGKEFNSRRVGYILRNSKKENNISGVT